MNPQSLTGLTALEAFSRLQKFGKNTLKLKSKRPLILEFFDEFKDLMVLILLGAGIISFIAGEREDSVMIGFIVLLNATIGFIQKFRAEKAVEALQKMLAPQARVLRDNREQMIPADYVVPGDILIISEGDRISADAKIIEENEFETQESILTGESIPVKKPAGMTIFMGTIATHGNAKAIVENTGMQTKFGKIAQLTSTTTKDLSPLEKELHHIGIFIGKITLVIGGILILVGVFAQQKPVLQTILFAASVAVAAVPEGLPTTVTIALALGVQRLAEKKAIMKQLSSVETLGSTTVIVSDKTGTLTKNVMEVKELRLPGHEIVLGENKYLPHPSTLEAITLICCVSSICNNAKIAADGAILGDPTEAALIQLVRKIGIEENTITQGFQKIHEYPFDSKRKRMSVIAQKKNAYVFSKGAPSHILEVCTHIFKDEEIIPLTEELKKEIYEANDTMAKSALRVIALAYKKIENSKKIPQQEAESNLVFLGLTGIMDPPRLEVPAAIEAAEKAGIRIYIVTGDSGLTAAAIGKMIGLIKEENPEIITGDELEKLTETELREKLDQSELEGTAQKKIIFARVSPEDKLRIVNALKDLGEVVAVTGDGVNDAPALKRADIGIAMGITGTDVSKEAANMVLTDDSFATIVSAIEEGRTIYENLKKFLIYIFSSNIGELLVIFAALIAGLLSPLTAILLLVINVGTDVLPALALGIEKGEKETMQKPPRKETDHILNKKFITRCIFLGSLIGFTSLAAYIYSLYDNGWTWGSYIDENTTFYKKASTLTFVTLILGQMANAYNARSEIHSAFKNFFSNWKLLGAIFISIALIVATTELPALQQLLKITNLTPKEWGIAAIAAGIVLFAEEIRKIARNEVERRRAKQNV